MSARSLIAYHANCIDGFTSAWLCHKALKVTAEDMYIDLLPLQYGEAGLVQLRAALELGVSTFQSEEEYSTLYVVDFSLPVSELKHIKEHWPTLHTTILDHHKTAFEAYCPTLEVKEDSSLATELYGASIFLDNAHSGAGCVYEFFEDQLEDVCPSFVAMVEDYDLWKFKLQDTKAFNKYLCSRPKLLSEWESINSKLLDGYERARIMTRGSQLYYEHQKLVQEIAEQAKPYMFCAHCAMVVQCPPEHTSAVGNYIAERYPHRAALMFSPDTAANCINWSLRSVGDLDVSAIAKRYGGGGHKNAAGFKTILLGGTYRG